MALRRAISTVVPLSLRAVRSSRTFHNAICTVEKGSFIRELNRLPVAPFMRFSTKAVAEMHSSDKELVRIIEAETDCAIEEVETNTLEDAPEDFPFAIHDTPGEKTLLLKREIGDELIEVEVDMAYNESESESESGSEGVRLPMVVSLSKGDRPCLEFGITASTDEIVIDSLLIKEEETDEDEGGLPYEGPDFRDLDEKLQKSFLKYLDVRGINQSTVDYVMVYMANKDSKEYMEWLKKLKKYVE